MMDSMFGVQVGIVSVGFSWTIWGNHCKRII